MDAFKLAQYIIDEANKGKTSFFLDSNDKEFAIKPNGDRLEIHAIYNEDFFGFGNVTLPFTQDAEELAQDLYDIAHWPKTILPYRESGKHHHISIDHETLIKWINGDLMNENDALENELYRVLDRSRVRKGWKFGLEIQNGIIDAEFQKDNFYVQISEDTDFYFPEQNSMIISVRILQAVLEMAGIIEKNQDKDFREDIDILKAWINSQIESYEPDFEFKELKDMKDKLIYELGLPDNTREADKIKDFDYWPVYIWDYLNRKEQYMMRIRTDLYYEPETPEQLISICEILDYGIGAIRKMNVLVGN